MMPKLLFILIGLIAGSALTTGTVKLTQKQIPPCPVCPTPPRCPPATQIKMQDLKEINNKKGVLSISQEFNNVTILVSACDTVTLKQLRK